MKRNNFLKSLLGLPFVAPLLDKVQATAPREEVAVFTEEMLRRYNFGLFIINSKVKEITLQNVGYASSVSWKLGFKFYEPLPGRRTRRVGQYYTMSNFLTDGWSYRIGNNIQEVCNYLNNNPYGEKYRPLTKEEVIFMIANRKQGFLQI